VTATAHPALEVDYITGGWIGIAGPGLWLLTEAGSSGQFVRECWRSIRGGGEAGELLSVLHGPLADGLPSFALLEVTAWSTRAAVRGTASIRLLAVDGGPVALVSGAAAGAGLGETVDRLMDWPAISFQLSAGPESAWPPRDGQLLLPVEAGAMLATAIGGRPRTAADVVGRADRQSRGQSSVPQTQPQPQPQLQPQPALVEAEDPDLMPTQFAPPKVPVLAPPTGPKFDIAPEASPNLASEYIAQTLEAARNMNVTVQHQPSAAESAPISQNPTPELDTGSDLIWKIDWFSEGGGEQSAPIPAPIPAASPQPIIPANWSMPVVEPSGVDEAEKAEEIGQVDEVEAEVPEEDTSVTVRRSDKAAQGQSADGAGGRPLIPAVSCPAGHLNPPQLDPIQSGKCRICAAVVAPQDSILIPQPALGVLRLSTGGDIPLDRDVFLGRDPSNNEDRKARKPHILRLPSPGKDISRDHLEIRLIGWRVMVIDLGSANGTTVVMPGGTPEPLAAGGTRIIEPGTQVILADEVSFVYEVTA